MALCIMSPGEAGAQSANMGGVHFGRNRYHNELLWMTLLLVFQAVTSATVQRPIFVVGNMANTVEDVDRFLTEGANAIEVDVRFSEDGNAVRVYHGSPCDCFRDCQGETSFAEYLEYIRSVTSVAGAKYQNKLGLLYLDLNTRDISRANYNQGGVSVASAVVQHLWRNVSAGIGVNVLFYVNGVNHKDVFKGVMDTIGALPDSGNWKDRIGFDFGSFLSLPDIGDAFAELNITTHRWQGDGATNCVADITGSALIRRIVDCRDGESRNCDYVDKAYVWDLDRSRIIKRMITAGSDGIITNKPATVIEVLMEPDVASLARIADQRDSPWARVVIKS